MALIPPHRRPCVESLPEHLANVEAVLGLWARSAQPGPLADAVSAYQAASEALRGTLQRGVRQADPDATSLAALPVPDDPSAGLGPEGAPGPRALVAMSRTSRAIDAVLRVRGFMVSRCAPAQVVECACELLPALVVLDPFSEPEGWASLYAWRREAQLAHTEVLLVKPAEGRDVAPFGDAAFLARPLGRGDLTTRVRALMAGRENVHRVVVASADDSCQRLETVLAAGGVELCRAPNAQALLARVAEGADAVFVPLVFDGLGADELLARLRPRGAGPGIIFLLGPGDADDERVTTLGERLVGTACEPLARALDGLMARVERADETAGPVSRGVLPVRAFLTLFERVLDYVTRHGRRMLVLRVGFSDGPEGAVVPEEVWRELAGELALRFRLHDQVARSRAFGVLLLLVDALPEHLARFQAAIFEPVHRVLADRCGRPLPPFVFDAITCPDEARDVPSLLARLG